MISIEGSDVVIDERLMIVYLKPVACILWVNESDKMYTNGKACCQQREICAYIQFQLFSKFSLAVSQRCL